MLNILHHNASSPSAATTSSMNHQHVSSASLLSPTTATAYQQPANSTTSSVAIVTINNNASPRGSLLVGGNSGVNSGTCRSSLNCADKLMQRRSTSANSTTSDSDFATVSELLKTYNNFESFIQQNDGKQRLKEYLESARNDEQLVFIEALEPWFSKNPKIQHRISSCDEELDESDSSDSNSVGSLNSNLSNVMMTCLENDEIFVDKLMNIKVIDNATEKVFGNVDIQHLSYLDISLIVVEKFLNDDSQFELNVSSKTKAAVNKAAKEQDESEAKKVLKTLYQSVLSQMKEEVFNHLRKTEDFKIWVLSKAIEFSQKEEQKSVEEFLKENHMDENWSLFKKKKLLVMKDIRDMTEEDYKKLGVKKLGHVKRLVRKTAEHFQK
ncbi:predicted protein [Naegleria gruberi]|uniref:Predicted protein n=1 Tax=Naegleria gruberi TaxID=5762 RepID=D2VV95_NAEGR|nr:uncharacterized protein NAEGRDRAFT_72937 [Naegleria gruberi]EFC39271.1 predicted protein [Naegleria gruberi]|eukprot:XP_002672015.1 predicted protein [Naegleria gruberi strain NEG-M]